MRPIRESKENSPGDHYGQDAHMQINRGRWNIPSTVVCITKRLEVTYVWPTGFVWREIADGAEPEQNSKRGENSSDVGHESKENSRADR